MFRNCFKLKPAAGTCRGKYSNLGLDLGSAMIKILQLKRHRGRIAVHQRVALQPSSAYNGQMPGNERKALIEKLTRCRLESGFRGNRVNLCLSGRDCYMKALVMPPMKPKELIKALHLEAEKIFPLKADEAVINYCDNGAANHNGREAREVLLVATTKNKADYYTSLALEAGFDPVSLETEPLSLLRSLYHRSPRSAKVNKPRLLLEIGSVTSKLLLLERGYYRYHRVLSAGIKSICRPLTTHPARSRLENTINTAGRQVTGKNVETRKRPVENAAFQLVRSIEETLEYWAVQGDQDRLNLTSMELCGGGVFIPGLASYLQENLNLKIILHDPLRQLAGKPGPGQGADHSGLVYATAHGLALGGWLR